MRRFVLAGALAVALVVVAPAGAAFAHPLGNFTVNTYAGIVVTPGEIRVEYALDLAEIPTFQEMAYVDTDVDGVASSEELSAYAPRKARELLARLSLAVDGRAVDLAVRSAVASLSPGQAGNDVLRLEVVYAGEAPGTGRVSYRDENFAELVGWREITAVGMGGRAVTGSTVPSESVSDRLRSYPEDLLSNPVEVTEASFSYAPGTGSEPGGSEGGSTGDGGARPGSEGGFAGLVDGPLSIGVVAAALLLAMGFGALHAVAPGHGKALMAAYLVGSGGRARHAVAVGAAVAAMHTASVIALFLIVLSVRSFFPAQEVYAWLGLATGLIALGLGTWLLIVRLQAWAEHRAHERAHAHGHEHPHEHASLPEGTSLLSRKGLLALAVAGGLVPSPTALLVLTGSVSADRVGFGLALVAAFSLGLAVALAVVGMVALGAKQLVSRKLSGGLARVIPILGAAVVIVAGGYLTVRGIVQL